MSAVSGAWLSERSIQHPQRMAASSPSLSSERSIQHPQRMAASSSRSVSYAAATPYLRSLGILGEQEPPPTAPTIAYETPSRSSASADAATEAMPAYTMEEAVDLLDTLQAQMQRALGDQQQSSSVQLEQMATELREVHGRATLALRMVADERGRSDRLHAADLEAHRRASGVALRSLHAELEGLRALHTREVEEVRQRAEDEKTRMREWCAAQIAAVEANRDALLGELAERREGALAAGDLQVERLMAEHKKDQSAVRQQLTDESERCATARNEVRELQVCASNERLKMQVELSNARRRASAASNEHGRKLKIAAEEAAEREASLQETIRRLKIQLDDEAKGGAKAIARSALKAEENAAHCAELRDHVAALTIKLNLAHVSQLKADDRAQKARDASVTLREQLKASDARLDQLRARAARRAQLLAKERRRTVPPSNAIGARSAWH